MYGWVILIILIAGVIATLPNYSYSREWGYRFSGIFGVMALIAIILILFGMI